MLLKHQNHNTCQNSLGKSPWADNVLRSVYCSSSEDDSPSSVVESSELGEVALLLILTALDDLQNRNINYDNGHPFGCVIQFTMGTNIICFF